MQIRYGLLFLVLFGSIFLANVTTLAVDKLWTYLEIHAIAEAAEKKLSYEMAKLDTEMKAQKMIADKKLAEVKMRAEEQRKKQEALAKRDAIESERRNNARRINKETCQFWRDKYNEDKSQKAKLMMESACNRL